MADISITEVTQHTGLPASTLRYYEELGLIHPTRRIGRRRQYDQSVLQRLALIQTGQQAGFTLTELGVLLNKVLGTEPGGAEWQALVARKMAEMEAMIRNIESMKRLLTDIMACDADSLAECIVLTGRKHAPTLAPLIPLKVK